MVGLAAESVREPKFQVVDDNPHDVVASVRGFERTTKAHPHLPALAPRPLRKKGLGLMLHPLALAPGPWWMMGLGLMLRCSTFVARTRALASRGRLQGPRCKRLRRLLKSQVQPVPLQPSGSSASDADRRGVSYRPTSIALRNRRAHATGQRARRYLYGKGSRINPRVSRHFVCVGLSCLPEFLCAKVCLGFRFGPAGPFRPRRGLVWVRWPGIGRALWPLGGWELNQVLA